MHRERDEDKEDRDCHGGPGGGPNHRDGRGRGRAGGEASDHLDETAALWEQAFYQALQELRVEAIKGRLKAAVGKNLDETAKTVFEMMMQEWKEARERAAQEAKERGAAGGGAGLRQGLKDAIQKGWKKGPQ